MSEGNGSAQKEITIERLEHDLARINDRLKRRGLDTKDVEILETKRLKTKYQAKLKFLKLQSVSSITQSLESIERQQLALAEQIEHLQERARYYTSLLVSRDDLIIEAELQIQRTQRHLDQLQGKHEEGSAEDVLSKWASVERFVTNGST